MKKMSSIHDLLVREAKEAAIRMIIEITYQMEQTKEIIELRKKLHELLEK